MPPLPKQMRSQKIKRLLKDWLPPGLIRLIPQKPASAWVGDYGSWAEARRASTGYDSAIILAKVREALLKVKRGEAVYERDSVLFDEIQYSWPLLAGLMWVAAQSQGELNVIDFGGSLGSTYFQNRKFLQALPQVRWNIVEQGHFVEVGKREFQSDTLKFYYDIESCLRETTPRAIVLSSVIQYLEKPYDFIQDIINLSFEFILIDRTPLINSGRDRLTIQHVPPAICSAKYPHWFLSEQKVIDLFSKNYYLIEQFVSLANIINIDKNDEAIDFGMIWQLKEKNERDSQ